jgi:glycosyltransferase involved in cell wall biosynthesis
MSRPTGLSTYNEANANVEEGAPITYHACEDACSNAAGLENQLDKLPLISIVVPSYNQGCYLREALESIFRQEYPRLEVIVMDGGSNDDSVAIIRSFLDRIKHWQSQPDEGQSSAINQGIQYCTGDLVAWLNSDDYYWGDAFWKVGRAYSAFPDHGLYIGNGFRYIQREQKYQPFCRYHLALNREALIRGLDYILQPATFFNRSVWQRVGGLNANLRFCMDWDIIIRIASKHPAVLINDFLAVSREYEETKTNSGRMMRAVEICRMVQTHSGCEVTPGSLYFLLETLLGVTEDTASPELRRHLHEGIVAIRHDFARTYGNHDGFPETGDPQDHTHLPIASHDVPQRVYLLNDLRLPSISIVTPSFNQAAFLGRTLESILSQGYPKLETLVFDGGSSDGSIEVLKQYEDRLSYWESERDRGPAHAINKGLKRATGEIVGWLNSDDLLASDALWEVGRAFAKDPDLDMVYANAVYIDENDRLLVVDHGSYRTGLYRGEMQPLEQIPAYWSYIHSVPQPTVFFRRRLLESCGYLDESFHYIFDFELFWRFCWKAKIKKIERTQAFYRIHAASKTSDWNKFLVELYRFSRPWWPKVFSPHFFGTFRDFIKSYMNRRFGSRSQDFWFWGAAALVGLSAITSIGNPEALQLRLPSRKRELRQPSPPPQRKPDGKPGGLFNRTPDSPSLVIERNHLPYRSFFSSYYLPLYPGYSGGEIRDFHLLKHLLSISSVEFFSSFDSIPDQRKDLLSPYLDAVHSPETICARRPELLDPRSFRMLGRARLVNRLRRSGIPVVGPRYHLDASEKAPHVNAHSRNVIEEALRSRQPDFLFVSPQTNPLALALATHGLDTRLILASYDVEAVRVQRIAASQSGLQRLAMSLEARRAVSFERDNLARFDGIIAVSKLDKDIFISSYAFPAERVVVIENGVDPNYFRFTERKKMDRPHVVFVGSLGYLPNQQAAWRLLKQIMPLVWRRYPDAAVSIVGQCPEQGLVAQDDGRRIFVTGRVEDVRPYLADASLVCIPLISGSGTKYKVLEAMSAGVPVVCSPLAAEGLDLEDGTHLLVSHSDEQFAAAIGRLLADPAMSTAIARQAREQIVFRYAWDANLSNLDDWLDTLHLMPRRTNSTL